MHVLFMAIAGALGTMLRYGIGKWINYENFPVATLCINSLGSLVLGFLFIKYAENNLQWYLIMGIGFCGGFTTYSTFSLDMYKMIVNLQYMNFAVYLTATIALGLLAVFVGACLGKNI